MLINCFHLQSINSGSLLSHSFLHQSLHLHTDSANHLQHSDIENSLIVYNHIHNYCDSCAHFSYSFHLLDHYLLHSL